MTHNFYFYFYKPILKRLQTKAQQAYRDSNSGLPPKIPNDIFKPSNPGEETNDELSIFSGKTHTLTAKSTSSAVASTAGTVNTPSSFSNKSRSSSDSPQLVMPDNPSFKGVHSSLVSEFNVFNGLIKRQLESAYKAGGEVFGGGEPMVVDDGQGSGGGGVQYHQQPTKMHVVRQHREQQQQMQQQQPQQVMYQPDYQRQHFDEREAKRLEREREESADRGMERQEMEKHDVERQELARQQQLHQQREIQRQQQHELLRQQQQVQQVIIQQQQQLDIRRQQEKQQQQMQDQYRQQLEVPQHQLQQGQPPQYHLQRHSYDHDQPLMFTEPDHGMATSSAHPAAPPIPTLSHSQSHSNIHHTYQQRPHHYQPMHHPNTASVSSYEPPPPPQRVTQLTQQPIRYSTLAQQQQQHSMYAVPPEYSSPDSIQTSVSYVPPSTSTYLPPTPISATSSSSSYIPHWSTGSYSFAMPDQQATSASTVSGAGSVHAWATTPRIQTPEYQQHQQYTPEGALRGIAADDRSLQETWQSYMNKVLTPPIFCLLSSFYWMMIANPLISFLYIKVGSPRQFIDD